MAIHFEVARGDLHRFRVQVAEAPALEAGQARLRVDAFALTANNITYATFGDAMSYWAAFPADQAWGRVPVWGFAQVVESEHDKVREGKRVYGLLPMSTEVVVAPGPVDERGFADGTEHRSALAATYRRYSRVDAQSIYRQEREGHQMLLWPLFLTSFLIDDLLADNAMFGATTVVMTSASSKTALGTAYLLAARGSLEVVGLTSPANIAFCEGLGVYDKVVAYDAIGSLPVRAAVLVDVAGSAEARNEIHRHYAGELRYTSLVGASHRDELGGAPPDLPGPAPRFFFAPDQIDQRTSDWGPEVLQQRVDAAWQRYVDWSDNWLRIEHGRGAAAVGRVYRKVLDGKVAPATGQVLSMWP